jgi:hypothetical protein
LKTYSFHTGQPPVQARFLFNTVEHTQLQSATGWLLFYALQNKTCVAIANIHVAAGKASTPLRAPFGSIECVEPVGVEVLYDFVTYIEEQVHREGATEIYLTLPPLEYYPEGNLLIPFLLTKGYAASAEISSIITVTSIPYREAIHNWELRKLKQAGGSGVTVTREPFTQLDSLYFFIEDCRRRKGYALSLSINQLQQLQQTFPEKIVLFSASIETHLVAACISIRISNDILYTFYYDHSATYQAISPVVLLLEGIYDYCAANGIKYIDLGTASAEGKPNFSLLQFKQHVGGKPSSKFSLVKK